MLSFLLFLVLLPFLIWVYNHITWSLFIYYKIFIEYVVCPNVFLVCFATQMEQQNKWRENPYTVFILAEGGAYYIKE